MKGECENERKSREGLKRAGLFKALGLVETAKIEKNSENKTHRFWRKGGVGWKKWEKKRQISENYSPQMVEEEC